MSGQNPSMLPFADTLNVLRDTVASAVFEVSSVVDNGPILSEGLVLLDMVPIHYPTWVFLYLFTLLAFFAWVMLYYGNIFTQTIQATVNYQVSSRMYKDNSQLQSQLDGSLYVLYFLAVAFLLNFLEIRMDVIPYDLHGALLYLFNLALLVGVFLGRVLLVNVVGILFDRVQILREYQFNAFIFNKVMGMAALLMSLFLLYTTGTVREVVFWTTLVLIALILIMRLIRGIVFSFRKDVSFFYLFLYLCALEIVPLVLLYRWLEDIL